MELNQVSKYVNLQLNEKLLMSEKYELEIVTYAWKTINFISKEK